MTVQHLCEIGIIKSWTKKIPYNLNKKYIKNLCYQVYSALSCNKDNVVTKHGSYKTTKYIPCSSWIEMKAQDFLKPKWHPPKCYMVIVWWLASIVIHWWSHHNKNWMNTILPQLLSRMRKLHWLLIENSIPEPGGVYLDTVEKGQAITAQW